MVICLKRGADLHMSQLMPMPLTISCFSKIRIGFTFLVPAHPGSPGQRAVKCMYVYNRKITARISVQETDSFTETTVQSTEEYLSIEKETRLDTSVMTKNEKDSAGGQDSPWKSQSERQKTEINGQSTSMVWPTLGSRTAKEQNIRKQCIGRVLSSLP